MFYLLVSILDTRQQIVDFFITHMCRPRNTALDVGMLRRMFGPLAMKNPQR